MSIKQRYHLGDEVLVLIRHSPSSRPTKTNKGKWVRGRVMGADLHAGFGRGEYVVYTVMASGRRLTNRQEQDLRPVSAVDGLANIARRNDGRR